MEVSLAPWVRPLPQSPPPLVVSRRSEVSPTSFAGSCDQCSRSYHLPSCWPPSRGEAPDSINSNKKYSVHCTLYDSQSRMCLLLPQKANFLAITYSSLQGSVVLRCKSGRGCSGCGHSCRGGSRHGSRCLALLADGGVVDWY